MFKKKSNQPTTVEQNLNAYRVRIVIAKKPSDSTATIESFVKNWKVVFRADQKMFHHIVTHFNNKSWEELEMLASALYKGCILTVIDAEFLRGLAGLFGDYDKRQMSIEPEQTDETEEEILKQEKIKQEFKEALLKENEDRKN